MFRLTVLFLATLFWNGDQHRIRTGWRLLIHLFLWIGIPALLSAVIISLLGPILNQQIPGSAVLAQRVISSTLTLVGAIAGTWIAVRFLDHRPFVDLGFHFNRQWWIDLLFGLALGALLMGLIFMTEWSLGWIEITGSFTTSSRSVTGDRLPFAVSILGPFVVFIVVGITEELLSRGYQLRNLAEGFNFPWMGPRGAILMAWLLSSSLFGLLHVFNPNASAVSTVNLILAGLFLGLGYILTGSLAIPIGLHITWNFFQGNVFGFPVSGNDFSTATFIAIRQGGPELWTGGAFGPEAGLIWRRRNGARCAVDLALGPMVGWRPTDLYRTGKLFGTRQSDKIGRNRSQCSHS